MKRIIIAGGGTGGHLYPGIAVAREMQKRYKDIEILFVGTENGIEAKVLPKEGFKLRTIRIAGLIGKGLLKKLGTLIMIPMSLIDSFKILSEFRPQCVIGVGGYASGPIILSAVIRRIPTVILEQNVIPGATNRMLSYLVDKAAVAFDDTRKFLSKGCSAVVAGNPIREEIYNRKAERTSAKFTILIFGGSLGAHTINIKMVEAIGYLNLMKDKIRIIHQTGEGDYGVVKDAYDKAGCDAVVSPYIYDMASAYSEADLVISRAGATTVAELTACGKAAILIPFPFATHNHQEMNARALEWAGAAEVILNKDLNGKLIADRVFYYANNRDRLEEMKKKSMGLGKRNAASKIVNICGELFTGDV
ncbi:MAG: undecaprenyldiphospho-muramoylpentapeptide beta-N-acetylglucosaminyltransferase [Nitrospirota bacterium]